ncbi:hypothetical protein HDU97_002706 [Phlyctochytrium planicorne]|nr:hypothetical protein HDU97_002706 [Phlyctochytrium planicorne]
MSAGAPTAGRQLFVGNLPFVVGWQDLKDLFRETGNVIRADVAIGPNGKSRGFGTVLLSTAEEANAAIAAFNNYEWHGRKIEVREDRAVASAGGLHHGSNGAHPKIDGQASNVPLPGTSSDASSLNTRALYVGNLPYSIGWQDLKDLFRNAGGVVRADIPADYQGKSKGFGTVVMNTVDEARKAVVLYNGYELNGRRIEVREDRTHFEPGAARGPTPNKPHTDNHHHHHHGGFQGGNLGHSSSFSHNSGPSAVSSISSAPIAGRVLFVGNLPFTVQWQELKDHFRQYGSVQRADIANDNQGKSRGYGQIVMSTPEEAAAAIKAVNNTEFQGRLIEVREDKYSAESGGAAVGGTQVFVGNLPYSTRWQDLKDLFRPHGLNPIHADILSEPGTGRSKGCGVVRFAAREEADRAVQNLNGTNVAGRNIVVRLDKFS